MKISQKSASFTEEIPAEVTIAKNLQNQKRQEPTLKVFWKS